MLRPFELRLVILHCSNEIKTIFCIDKSFETRHFYHTDTSYQYRVSHCVITSSMLSRLFNSSSITSQTYIIRNYFKTLLNESHIFIYQNYYFPNIVSHDADILKRTCATQPFHDMQHPRAQPACMRT